MLIKNIFLNLKILKKNKIMILGIHYFITKVKTKIDVIPRGCFNSNQANILFASAGYIFLPIIHNYRSLRILIVILLSYKTLCQVWPTMTTDGLSTIMGMTTPFMWYEACLLYNHQEWLCSPCHVLFGFSCNLSTCTTQQRQTTALPCRAKRQYLSSVAYFTLVAVDTRGWYGVMLEFDQIALLREISYYPVSFSCDLLIIIRTLSKPWLTGFFNHGVNSN